MPAAAPLALALALALLLVLPSPAAAQRLAGGSGSGRARAAQGVALESSPGAALESTPGALPLPRVPLPGTCLLRCFAGVPHAACGRCVPCVQDAEAGCESQGRVFLAEKCACGRRNVTMDITACLEKIPECAEPKVRNLDACTCECSRDTASLCRYAGFTFNEESCQCSGGGLVCPVEKIPNVKRGVCECTESRKENCVRQLFENLPPRVFDPETCSCALDPDFLAQAQAQALSAPA